MKNYRFIVVNRATQETKTRWRTAYSLEGAWAAISEDFPSDQFDVSYEPTSDQ